MGGHLVNETSLQFSLSRHVFSGYGNEERIIVIDIKQQISNCTNIILTKT